MKKKALLFCLVTFCLVSFLLILNKIVDSTFYQYKKQILTEYKHIDKIELRNYGPECTIAIYVKDGHFDYEEIEPIFIKAMIGIYQESYFQYFTECVNLENKTMWIYQIDETGCHVKYNPNNNVFMESFQNKRRK